MERSSQLLALGGEALTVCSKPQLGLGEELLLALTELGDVQLGRLCGAVEILRPAGESLLDLRLRIGQRLGKRGGEGLLALGKLAAVILGKLAFFLDEQGHRVRPRASERALEFRGASFGLVFDEVMQAGPRFLQMSVRLPGLDERAVKRDCG